MRPKFDQAKEIVARMNQTIPALDYRAGLVAFGSGSCLDGKDARVLYGITSYRRSDFANGLDSQKCAGGVSPLSEGIGLSQSNLQAGTKNSLKFNQERLTAEDARWASSF
jgi:hypothetical protein